MLPIFGLVFTSTSSWNTAISSGGRFRSKTRSPRRIAARRGSSGRNTGRGRRHTRFSPCSQRRTVSRLTRIEATFNSNTAKHSHVHRLRRNPKSVGPCLVPPLTTIPAIQPGKNERRPPPFPTNPPPPQPHHHLGPPPTLRIGMFPKHRHQPLAFGRPQRETAIHGPASRVTGFCSTTRYPGGKPVSFSRGAI